MTAKRRPRSAGTLPSVDRSGAKPRKPKVAAAAKRTVRADASEAEALLRELDVHREELACQNDELRRANAELMTSKERYAQLYDGAPIGYFTLDEAGIIVEANLAGADLLDASRNALFGHSFDELVVPGSRESFRNFRRRVVAQGGRPVHETLLVMDGRRFPVRIEAACLSSAAIPRSQCLLCVTDETERKYLEEQRRTLEARVAETHRRESLGVLAGGIAHEFNNILAVVLAHVDLALMDAPESSEKHGAIADIREAAVRAADLSKQMLAFSGRTRVHAEAVDVSGVIRAMGALLATSAPKEVELVLDLAADLPSVVGDSLQIQQIVLNLVLNAVEGIGNSAGKIMVRTSACETSADAGSSRSEERVLIEVSDNGRGMDDATRRRAFDPFFSTKLTGRGLGLAVVHGNVRAHGGTVVVDSRPNGGATLRVYLPVAARLRLVAPATALPVDPAWTGTGLVLVVDDGNDTRETAGLALERIGFQVCFAVDTEDALATARRHSGQLAAVLLDLSMPSIDPAAMLAELKRINATLPVVLTSGYSDASFDKRLLMSASGFVPKPFTPASLLRAMERAVTRTESMKQNR